MLHFILLNLLSAISSSVLLGWDQPRDGGVMPSSYVVNYGYSSGNYIFSEPETNILHNVTNLVPGREYFFAVNAIYADPHDTNGVPVTFNAIYLAPGQTNTWISPSSEEVAVNTILPPLSLSLSPLGSIQANVFNRGEFKLLQSTDLSGTNWSTKYDFIAANDIVFLGTDMDQPMRAFKIQYVPFVYHPPRNLLTNNAPTNTPPEMPSGD